LAKQRHAEIAGAGFGGLIAAIALAERGWSVRVHEKTPILRAEGFAISTQPNVIRILETVGTRDQTVRGGMQIMHRETRNARNECTMSIRGGGHRISRQHMVTVLAARATSLGVDIAANSPVSGADPGGALILESGERLTADLVIGADGINSVVRDSVDLLRSAKLHADGAMRFLVPRARSEPTDTVAQPTTCEYWSGARRVITSPCSETELYVAMSCLATDKEAKAVPLDARSWTRSFPHLASLFSSIEATADWSRIRWVQFQTVKLKRWSAGRVAILGDAANAMPPNLAQGAGCAMMNALSLAVALDETPDIELALANWERRERPLVEHTQFWSSLYSGFTVWPEFLRSLAFAALGRFAWLRRRYQRTANHIPTGYRPAAPPQETRS
jgi:2-polyprenyl-6-methoxyphenol hydroxylase-like FAD-dependent oxidoreductase